MDGPRFHEQVPTFVIEQKEVVPHYLVVVFYFLSQLLALRVITLNLLSLVAIVCYGAKETWALYCSNISWF